jgi:hypothetical protein
MRETVARYEGGIGIRPPRKGGKVRGIARVYEPDGGMELWACDHNHAPGVKSCEDVTPEQRAEASQCAKAWLDGQVAAGHLAVLPVMIEGDMPEDALVISLADFEAMRMEGQPVAASAARGGVPRTDGSEPAPADAVAQHLARQLGVYEDGEGYIWIKVGPDHFVCLDTPLLRAIADKWVPVSLAAATEVGRELVKMEARW